MINTTPLSNIIVEANLEFSMDVKKVERTMFNPAKKSPINMILKPSVASLVNVRLLFLLNKEVTLPALKNILV